MKVTEEFLKAKRKKTVDTFMVILKEGGEQVIRISDDHNKPSVETPAEISIENYSRPEQGGRKIIKRIFFYERFFQGSFSHIRTFLNAINKNSDIKFKVIAFNNSDFLVRHNMTSHQLYGIIDGKKSFLLSSFTGEQNTASPIHEV